MNDLLIFIAGLVLLLVGDFFLITARTAFMSTNHARLLALREQHEQQVNQTSSLLPSLQRLRATLNLALGIVRFLLLWLVLYFLSTLDLRYPALTDVVVAVIGGIVLFWFEATVEKTVLGNAEIWALRLTPFARALMSVLSVLILPVGLPKEIEIAPELLAMVTEDELKTLVDAGQEEGVFEQGERRMIYSIFELSDTLVREIMVPRIDMLALEVRTPLTDAVDALLRSGHSRVPVFDETVDNTLGLLYAKDILRAWSEGNQISSLRDLLRPAYFVPEAKKVDELLEEMQSRRVHMAVVFDEYGGVAGLVTLEDIVEEILGEIRDEYDQAEEMPYQALRDGSYIFQARIDLDDFNEVMGAHLPKDEADTVGGFIYSRLGQVPDVGDTVEQDNLLLTVEQVTGRRIHKVRAQWLEDQNDRQGEEHQVEQ